MDFFYAVVPLSSKSPDLSHKYHLSSVDVNWHPNIKSTNSAQLITLTVSPRGFDRGFLGDERLLLHFLAAGSASSLLSGT